MIRSEVDGETLTRVVFDMEAYFAAAVAEYEKLSGETVSKVFTPFAPKIASEELDALLSQPGHMAKHAASLVMRLMYGVRMAMPHLCVVVSQLTQDISYFRIFLFPAFVS